MRRHYDDDPFGSPYEPLTPAQILVAGIIVALGLLMLVPIVLIGGTILARFVFALPDIVAMLGGA